MRAALAACVVLMTSGLSMADVADLENLNLPPGGYWNGGDGSGGFASGGVTFANNFVDWGGGYSWDGFAYSNVSDTTTPGYEDQYAAFTGSGYGGAGNYAIGYVPLDFYSGTYAPIPIIATLESPSALGMVRVTNTTYAALSMKNGDWAAKKFGGVSGNDPDWYKLMIAGKDASGNLTGTVEFYLADYRFADNNSDYIVDTWKAVDLSSLGVVKRLEFSLASSDTGIFGMNTPTYFALDSLQVPEPATLGLMGIGGLAMLLRRRRQGGAKRLACFLLVGAMATGAASSAFAGPYAPAAGQSGSTAIYKDDPGFVDWATGWRDYIVGSNCDLTWQTPEKALGKATGTSYDICCLGNGGSIIMTFASAIADGPGADFAIFENGVTDTFLELAYVEVSADGQNFVRFPNRSLTASSVGAFGAVDPTNIVGLGCKYRQGYGEPYDLADVGLSQILYVQLVDIIGDAAHNNLDSDGYLIYDPTPTVGSGGFDLDAIGVIHQVPEPATLSLLACGVLALGMRKRTKVSR